MLLLTGYGQTRRLKSKTLDVKNHTAHWSVVDDPQTALPGFKALGAIEDIGKENRTAKRTRRRKKHKYKWVGMDGLPQGR